MKFKPNWGWASLPALLMVWVIVASHYPSYVLPQPWDVWREAIRWFSDGSIWGQLQASLLEEFTGFMTAVLLALILGVSAGLSDRVREFLTPLNSLFMAIPPIAWAPLMLLIFGLGFVSIVVVIVIAALFPMCLAIQEGIRGIRGGEVRAARTLGARPFQLLLHVSAQFPAIYHRRTAHRIQPGMACAGGSGNARRLSGHRLDGCHGRTDG